MKKVLVLILVVVLAIGAVGCTKKEDTITPEITKTTVDQIKEKGKLVVGTSADYPPYEYHKMIDGKDTIVGFDIELAKLIAEKMGVTLELQDMAFEGLLIGLTEDKYDMVIAGLTVDPKRQVLFSNNYHSREQAIIIKKENADQYKVQTDLAGKKVGGQKGTVQEELAKTIAENTTPIALVKFPDLINEVKNGTIDAMIADSDVALGYVAANEDLMISDIKLDYENSNVAIAFKQDNQALCDEVNAILAELQGDGTIDKIIKESMTTSQLE